MVNAVGVDKPTESEIDERWKNLHSAAKREFTKFRKESKKTGGGPAPKEISLTTSKVIELFQDTSSFVGLVGFETNCPMVSQHFKLSFPHYELNFLFYNVTSWSLFSSTSPVSSSKSSKKKWVNRLSIINACFSVFC